MGSYNWERPAYPIAAVENALQLIQMLRDEGPLQLQEAAQRIGVAPSTAHRLLAMLVYRGYAVQHRERGFYEPGPSLGARPATRPHLAEYAAEARPLIDHLVETVGYTSHLVVRVSLDVRTILAVEASGPGSIRSRYGTVMPATMASGGKVLLAPFHDAALRSILRSESGRVILTEPEFERLMNELRRVRRLGYALNEGGTERAIASISLPIWDENQIPVAAIGLSAPRDEGPILTSSSVLDELRSAQRALSTLFVDVRRGETTRNEGGDGSGAS